MGEESKEGRQGAPFFFLADSRGGGAMLPWKGGGAMKECPTCKGKGKLKVVVRVREVTPVGVTHIPPLEISCVVCEGVGKVTAAKLEAMKAEADLWCSCGNPSGNSKYHDDGDHPNCSKHCWTCEDCGKILQVG